MSVGVGEGLGEVELVAAGTTLCVGVGVELAALPHPAANKAANAIAATFTKVTAVSVGHAIWSG